ncbi:MAG: DUF5009 domain-containing protein [Flavobacteriaceae bacterium]|nr:DUF5009 domain-containing protein [Flavobacteriaceae bacterium]
MKQRLLSVDVLRGITIAGMILVNTPGTWSAVYPPLLHADWHGLTPTDLVFPFFLFIVGVSIAIAYERKKADAKTLKKIVSRSVKLIFLGLFLAAFLPFPPFLKDFETLRLPGVLQRIGLVFFISALVYLYTNTRKQIMILGGLMLGYFIWIKYIPLPNGHLPVLERSADNWAQYIDFHLFGKHMWKTDYDPEGLLSTLGAVATCVFGILMGKLLLQKRIRDMVVFAFIALFFGFVWHVFFPINKALWSSSFVLVTGGLATLLLSALYYWFDVLKRSWGASFQFFGTNPIALFFASSFVAKCFYLIKLPVKGNPSIHQFLFETIYVQDFLPLKTSSLLYALSVVAFYYAVGYILYIKRIFIKV